jgi:hypothetical protein
MQFSFDNVQAAEEGKGFTEPGVIDVFTISKVEYKKNESNGKESFEVTFERKEDSFREYFHLTEKAAPRFMYLYEKVMDTKNLPENEQGIITALTGKSIAIKVIGSVNEQSGKGYPCLPFSGFAKPVGEVGDLKFSNTEIGKIEAAKQAQRSSAAASTAQAGTAGNAPIPAANDAF